MAVPDDAFLTEYKDYSLQNTIAGIEGRLDNGELDPDEYGDDDVLPSVAAEMGAGHYLQSNVSLILLGTVQCPGKCILS